MRKKVLKSDLSSEDNRCYPLNRVHYSQWGIPMRTFWQRLLGEPALVTGLIIAAINVLVAFGVWAPSETQLATLNAFLAALFAVVVRFVVSPNRGEPFGADPAPNPAG